MTTTTQRPTNAGQVVNARKALIEYFQSNEVTSRVEVAVPKGVDHKYLLASFRLALASNPKLQQCTQVSLYTCLMKLAQTGLLPDGRDAHILPYGEVATVLFDYKGIARLVMNSGEVSSLEVDCVHDSDDFSFTRGADGKLHHRPCLRGDRGEMYAVYSYVIFSNGRTSSCVMRRDEVDAVRSRSKAANNGPWVSDYNEMAKKTVFRRHSKLLPFSPQLRQRIEADDDVLTDEARAERISRASEVLAERRSPKSFLGSPEDNEPSEAPVEVEPLDLRGKSGLRSPRQQLKSEPASDIPVTATDDAFYAELGRILKAQGVTLSAFLSMAAAGGMIPDATSYGTMEEIPIGTVKTLLKDKQTLINALVASKA